ncbi:unnamed protein product, partial [Prorocentrum cordatum]
APAQSRPAAAGHPAARQAKTGLPAPATAGDAAGQLAGMGLAAAPGSLAAAGSARSAVQQGRARHGAPAGRALDGEAFHAAATPCFAEPGVVRVRDPPHNAAQRASLHNV